MIEGFSSLFIASQQLYLVDNDVFKMLTSALIFHHICISHNFLTSCTSDLLSNSPSPLWWGGKKRRWCIFVQWLAMSGINKDDVTQSVISHYKSMGSPHAWAYSQWLYFLKSTAGITMCDKRLVSLPGRKYEGHVTTPTHPPVSNADETRNQPSLLRGDERL